MDVRTRILQAAAELVAQAPDADVSTRAVCEAAGVGAPALYRQFGDKDGLLVAVAAYGYDKYLASKRSLQPSDDPVADLYAGWENHVAFALENPSFYKLMWAPGLAVPVSSAAEAHRMLEAVLERCAAAGRLRIPPATAAMLIMSAHAGVALSLIYRPELFPDPGVTTRMRDAVFAAVLTDSPTHDSADSSVTTVAARLRHNPPAALSGSEHALLQEWLARIAQS
jgi:AcrR family transcriptional regulator